MRLSDSLENLRCHFKVAGTEFSSLWCFFVSSTHTFYSGLEGEADVLSPWKRGASDELTQPFWAEELSAYCENVLPILFPQSSHHCLRYDLFVNLRPKNLNAVIVTGPTGFVWPRCRDGCRLLPEHRQFHRWRWGQAKG